MDSTLPQEIIDMIIDFLHNDKCALITTSLICRSWLQSARYHLYSSITLFISSSDTINAFLGHLEATPSLGPLIRSLTLRGPGSDSQFATIRICAATICRILEKLPSVVTLTLDTIVWSLVPTHPLEATQQGAGSAKLHNLGLSRVVSCERTDPSDEELTANTLFGILRSFNGIRSLHLDDVFLESNIFVGDTPQDEVNDALASLALEDLSLHQTSSLNTFLRTLRLTQTPHSIHKLSYQPVGAMDAYLFRVFLSFLASVGKLQELEIRLDNLRRPLFLTLGTVERMLSVALRELTSLHTLRLRVLADHCHGGMNFPLTRTASGYPMLAYIIPSMANAVEHLGITVVVSTATGMTERTAVQCAEFMQGDEFRASLGLLEERIRRGELKRLDVEVVSEESEDAKAAEDLRRKVEARVMSAFESCFALLRNVTSDL